MLYSASNAVTSDAVTSDALTSDAVTSDAVANDAVTMQLAQGPMCLFKPILIELAS